VQFVIAKYDNKSKVAHRRHIEIVFGYSSASYYLINAKFWVRK